MHGDHPTPEPLATPDDAHDAPDAAVAVLADTPEPAPKARSLGPLRMVFGTALQYPRQIALALLALLIGANALVDGQLVVNPALSYIQDKPAIPAANSTVTGVQ